MKLILKVIFLLFFIKISITGIGQIQTEKFERISSKEGLSQKAISYILQDKKGFIWFGTQDGLFRYDGYVFVQYKLQNTKNNNENHYIRCIYEDSNGFIWIGTKDKGLKQFNRKTEKIKTFTFDSKDKNAISDSTINCIYEDSQGVFWIGTNNGLHIFNRQEQSFSKYAFLKKNNSDDFQTISKIIEDNEQNLWIGTENGLIKINKTRKDYTIYKSSTANPSTLSHNQIHTLFIDKEGILYIGTYKGLDIYNNKKNNFSCLTSNYDISAITQDKKGYIWFGTFGNGLIKYDKSNQKITEFTNDANNLESISSNYILSLYVDYSGLLWVGTYGDQNSCGINKLDLTRIRFEKIIQTDKKASISNEIYAITEDNQKNVWLGTDKGLKIYNPENNSYTVLQNYTFDKKSLSNNIINCIIQDKNENIWIGTDAGGINFLSKEKINKKQFEFIRLNEENEDFKNISKNILTLFEDKKGNIWIGTDDGIAIVSKERKIIQTIKKENSTTSLIADKIQSITQDKDGLFWIATSNGLSMYNEQTKIFKNFSYKPNQTNNISNNNLFCVITDSDNNIWIGTEGGGLSCFNKKLETFVNYTISNGLPDNYIYGIIEDSDKNIWVSTNKGLSKLIKNEDKSFSFINYNQSNWLHCNTFSIGAYHKGNSGKIYFGCNEGVVYFDPHEIKGNIYIPPVVFTAFQLGFKYVEISTDGTTPLSQTISETKIIELEYHQKRITFEFAALNFIQNQKNEYAYKMEGFDEDWIHIKNEHKAEYSGLSPGTYTFKVKASNNNGVWNEDGAAIVITINPPFWMTKTFYVFIVIVIIGIAIFWNRYRIRRIQIDKDYLEKLVQERTEELNLQKHELHVKAEQLRQANEELNTTNEELNATLENLRTTQTQLVQSEKMASLGQLTAGVAHEINNPINFISGNIIPLRKDIDDILCILDLYDSIVEQNNFNNKFSGIVNLKKEVDYEYVIKEIDNLIKGIAEGAARTTAIVKGLRNFSRLDEDDMKLANINEGLESTILILRNKLKNKVEVITQFGNIPEIICYPGKINQVFMNIINNAADAIKDKGNIFISTESDKNFVCIKIKDTGIGMPENIRKKIFEPFFTTKDVGEGTGLGLSISYGIIEKHKGKIDVISEVGAGTEFIITLPIIQDEEQ